MKPEIIKYLHDCFAKLVEQYGFSEIHEVNEDPTYFIVYSSDDFVIKLEHYRRVFDVILYKIEDPDNGVNLFNLLSYLNISYPEFDYYYDEFKNKKDLEDYYRNQIDYLSTALYTNFREIIDFLKKGDYKLKMMDIQKHMENKYPDLFKK